MKAGEYRKAIDAYHALCRGRPQDQELKKEYAGSLEEIKTVADKALRKGDFALAGRIYDILLNKYSCFNDIVRTLSFDKTHLNEKLSYCKKHLSAQGFQEYRKGNLREAIGLWQDLLAIDPDNADIKEVLRTATLQQKNLQERAAGR